MFAMNSISGISRALGIRAGAIVIVSSALLVAAACSTASQNGEAPARLPVKFAEKDPHVGGLSDTDSPVETYHGCETYTANPSSEQVTQAGEAIQAEQAEIVGPDGPQIHSFNELLDRNSEPNVFDMLDSAPDGAATQYLKKYCDLRLDSRDPRLGLTAARQLWVGVSHCAELFDYAHGRMPGTDVTFPGTEGKTTAELLEWAYRIEGDKYRIVADTICKGTLASISGPLTDPAQSESTPPRDQANGCFLSLGAYEGLVEVRAGTLDCGEATEVITVGHDQIISDGGKSTVLEVNGVTMWLCSYANTAIDTPDYTFMCDSPTGDKVVTWTEK